MRKNGINRQIYPIDGGLCAPSGFTLGGVSCGIKGTEQEDLALIVSERKCRTACVYSQTPVVGAPLVITKKHLENGLAQAIVINGGTANVFQENGEKIADRACRLVEQYHKISYDDVVIASTGEIGKKLSLQNFDIGLFGLKNNLGADDERRLAVERAISSEDGRAKSVAYSFELGAFTCKIGVLYKGSMHVCPNMATALFFLTTDANITAEMLQKALSAAVRDTVNMIDIDGTPSPNDLVCIMANGRAGNYCINCVDSEYDKFVAGLRLVLRAVCKNITREAGKSFDCHVTGGKSKQVARLLATALAGNSAIKQNIRKGKMDIEGIIHHLCAIESAPEIEDVKISLQSSSGQLFFFEDERKIPRVKERMEEIYQGENLTLSVCIGKGNYDATAFSVLD